jgi:hypothetical protein
MYFGQILGFIVKKVVFEPLHRESYEHNFLWKLGTRYAYPFALFSQHPIPPVLVNGYSFTISHVRPDVKPILVIVFDVEFISHCVVNRKNESLRLDSKT